MSRHTIRRLGHLCLSLVIGLWIGGFAPASARPNILWITIEDWSPDLSCYGTKGIHTPHVDKLASEGIRYETAFTTSPVCSTSRSAMMTGFHQNYIGAHQHRTDDKKPLPYGIRPIPHLFADAGYFTALMSWKTDCKVLPDQKKDVVMWEDGNELEPDQRGIYAGAIGYFGANGSMDTCIALRTAVVTEGTMYVQAGAGIVADIDPDSEHQECRNKARALIRAAEEAIDFALSRGN